MVSSDAVEDFRRVTVTEKNTGRRWRLDSEARGSGPLNKGIEPGLARTEDNNWKTVFTSKPEAASEPRG